MTTEERIAQIAQGFGQGIQNFQAGQERQRATQLQEEARRRQEALQAIETANVLGQQYGKQVDPASIQPFLQTGDLTGLGEILSSAPSRAIDPRAQIDAQIKQAQLAKIQAETANIGKQAKTQTQAVGKLEKLGTEGRGKVGSLASGFQALDSIEKSLTAGYKPEYFDANTPLIGGLISDTPLTEAQRTLSEVVGRLQSGGAINKEEEARFMAMGPRPGDNAESMKRKIQQQKDFLKNKLSAYGLKEEELEGAGFALRAPEVKPVKGGAVNSAMAADPISKAKQMSREQKIQLLMGNR